MYNPYYSNYYQPQQPSYQPVQPSVLPQQQIIQVNGKSSIDSMKLAPNSSVLVMDTSAPIVWMCVSDGIGNVTSTPYDIIRHEDAPPVDVSDIEKRLAAVEYAIRELGEKRNDKQSDDADVKSKQNQSKFNSR